jgi:hypothetical protein
MQNQCVLKNSSRFLRKKSDLTLEARQQSLFFHAQSLILKQDVAILSMHLRHLIRYKPEITKTRRGAVNKVTLRQAQPFFPQGGNVIVFVGSMHINVY